MLKIRLMRIGAKKRPFYRVVVMEERSKRTGGYVELLGTYNPLSEPKEIKLNTDRIAYWTKMGAQPSVGYLRIIGKAPQRSPRKPKKEKTPAVAPAKSPTEEKATGDTAKSETAEATPDSTSQQTRSETENIESESTSQDRSSDASQSDEQSAGPVAQDTAKSK